MIVKKKMKHLFKTCRTTLIISNISDDGHYIIKITNT